MLQRQLEINKCQKDIATENNEVDDKTPVIIEETYYIDMDVPGSKPFKSYMDARLITSTNSAQYKLKSEYELDDSGIYMIDGRYACAIGSYYTTEIGTKFDVVMISGEVIPCILLILSNLITAVVSSMFRSFLIKIHSYIRYLTFKNASTTIRNK